MDVNIHIDDRLVALARRILHRRALATALVCVVLASGGLAYATSATNAAERLAVSGPVSGYSQVGGSKTLAPGGQGSLTVTCPTGKKVVGGGFGMANGLQVQVSKPSAVDQWMVNGRNTSTLNLSMTAFAVCVDAAASP